MFTKQNYKINLRPKKKKKIEKEKSTHRGLLKRVYGKEYYVKTMHGFKTLSVAT